MEVLGMLAQLAINYLPRGARGIFNRKLNSQWIRNMFAGCENLSGALAAEVSQFLWLFSMFLFFCVPGGTCCPAILQYVTLNVTTNAFCHDIYSTALGWDVTADMICAADNGDMTDRDSCQVTG